MQKNDWIAQLNADDQAQRLGAVLKLKEMLGNGEIDLSEKEGVTNNHVHTRYSFSPYSPAKAVWMAYMAGLDTVGIMDHDAINGAEEFIEAGRILGIATTIGFEMRTDWTQTRLNGKRINNPDQLSNGYISAHGLPHGNIPAADTFLYPIRQGREIRNLKMVKKINALMQPFGILLDYDADILRQSYARFGGEVTERHLLYALAQKMIEKYGRGSELTDMLTDQLGIGLSSKQTGFLTDPQNDFFAYDLLNILKSSFIKKIYIDAEKPEIVPVEEAVDFIRSVGAIPSYCYLGDVGESPTGDKKAQKFEDDYLETVFDECKRIGFQAITYMPSRNTPEQLERVMALCEKHGLMQISGEDINQPRQSFVCKQLKDPRYRHLIDTTWALVGHERSATENIKDGMFTDRAPLSREALWERIEKYKQIALNS